MAINPDIRDRAYQFFIEEAPELLQAIEDGLLSLASERSTAKIHHLMRSAHSLKGGAASVELGVIETLAHRLETIFKALYDETLAIDTELETLLLQAYDSLRSPLFEQIGTGILDGDRALAAAEPIFSEIEERLGDALDNGDDYIPSSTELGIDMARSIFEVDVAQGLEQLEEAIANPQQSDVAGELQAQAELFTEFAELFDQPGFGAIAQTAQIALATHPDRALEITQLALVDFHQARDIILAGEDSQSIAPSAALAALTEVAAPFPETASDATFPSIEEMFGDMGALFDTEVAPNQETPQTPATAGTGGSDSTPPPQPEPAEKGELVRAQQAPHLSPSEQIAEPLHSQEEEQPRPPKEAAPAAKLSVRVDSERLERMNNLVGELSINRNGLSLQNDQLQGGVRSLLGRFARVRDVVSYLRQLSDEMLVAPERQRAGRVASSVGRTSKLATDFPADFDSLELDSYTSLHSRLQGLLEEMVQLEEAVDDIALFARATDRTLEQQRQMLAQLRDELMWARMLPLGEVLNRFPRVLRDLSTTYGKPVNLRLIGTRVLVDKAMLEKLYDPLLHLLRNAFDHGIESPESRREQGKSSTGQIEIRAYHQGSQTIIEVRDDGSGLNLERIAQRALELGWVSGEQLATLPPEQLFECLFEPGFSTARQVSELSGRGVGLDIVRAQVRSLKGTITVASAPGVGTTFTLRLPLTLTIAKLLVGFIGTRAVALPSDSIEEITVPTADQIKHTGKRRFLFWREEIVPIYRLADLLDYTCPMPAVSVSKALLPVPSPKDWGAPLLILQQEQYVVALEIDRLVTEQELVIKPFGSAIAAPDLTYGCTILGDGSLVPVLDGALLLERLVGEPRGAVAIETYRPGPMTEDPLEAILVEDNVATERTASRTASVTKTVLVVDDAATLRRTLALSLERAGYQVLQARDGLEAFTQLEQSASVDLVVCDIEMPNMNGFEFLEKRRRDGTFSGIPAIVLTSRSSEKHRTLAMQLGAKDYFTKPYLEQELLGAIANLIAAQPN
jgi:chemotaxis family two-component system sensor histidine kinase/response regulator PixL